MDAHRNFAYGTIITAPSPALTGTSLTVGTGQGARFTAPCNATVWPAGELPLDSNAEIVRITAVVGDVLTIVRQQEGSSGRSVIVGDQIANTITVKVVTDIEDAVSLAEAHAGTASAAVTSVDARVDTVSQAVSVISQKVSALSSQVSTVDVHAEMASAAATSADAHANLVSQAVSVVSVLVSAISILALAADAHASVASLAATSADGHANTVSVAAAAADAHASIASLAATSVDGRVTSLHALSVKSVGGTSVRGLQSVLNALSGRISAASGTGGGGSVTSQEVSVLVETASAAATSADAHANTASAAATSVDTRVNALSQIHSALSQQVSALSTQVSLVSVAVTSVDTRLNALSQLHSVLSQQVSALSTQVSVVSVAVGSVDSRVNSVNTTLSGLSVRSVGGVSTHGLQSVLDALSTRISATAAGTGSVTSNEVSAVSHNASVNNQSIVTFLSGMSVRSVGNVSTHGLQSVLDALSTRISATAAGTGSVTSTEVSAVSHNASVNNQSIVTFISGVSVRSVGDVSTHGLQSVINALSGRISATGAAISVTSDEMSVRVQVASAAATSADAHANAASAAATSVDARVNALSQLHSVLSQQVSALSTQVSLVSVAVTSVDTRVNAVSQAHSVLSQQVSVLSVQVSTVSIAVTSVDSRVTSVNVFISGISSRSVGDVSTHGLQSVINALSNRISAGGGAGSVTSTEVSAVSHNASVNNQSIVTFLSGVSARSALSATVSTHGLQSVVDALSNRISLNAKAISDMISAGGGGVSVTSNEVSVLLAAVSAQAASALSDAISAGSATASNLLSNINALSTTVSRDRWAMVQGIQSISATALLTVSGLSLAVSAGEAYKLDAQILYRMSVSNTVGFGIEFPGLSASNILIHGQGSVGPVAASSFSLLVVGGLDETGSNSVVFSAPVASGKTYRVEYNGIIVCSTAGAVHLKARVSVSSTAVEINRGSFLRLFKLS